MRETRGRETQENEQRRRGNKEHKRTSGLVLALKEGAYDCNSKEAQSVHTATVVDWRDKQVGKVSHGSTARHGEQDEWI